MQDRLVVAGTFVMGVLLIAGAIPLMLALRAGARHECQSAFPKPATIRSNPIGLSDCRVDVSFGTSLRTAVDSTCAIGQWAHQGETVDLALCPEHDEVLSIRSQTGTWVACGSSSDLMFVVPVIFGALGGMAIRGAFLRRRRAVQLAAAADEAPPRS